MTVGLQVVHMQKQKQADGVSKQQAAVVTAGADDSMCWQPVCAEEHEAARFSTILRNLNGSNLLATLTYRCVA